jgi:hypothetical protein
MIGARRTAAVATIAEPPDTTATGKRDFSKDCDGVKLRNDPR